MNRFFAHITLLITSAIIAGIALLFILDSIVMPFIVDVPSVRIPRLTGMPIVHATEKLSQWGLQTVVADSSFSEDIPIGSVISIRPNTGQRVKQGRAVALTISKGPRLYLVPDVRGASLREARLKLEANILKLGDVRYVSSENIPKTVILNQFPLAESLLPKYGEVNLHVSSGSERRLKSTPNLINTSIQDVEDSLLKYEMTIGEISETIGNDYPPGTILEQKPTAGIQTPRFTPIDLVISTITVPKLRQRDESR
ncbi:MAG: PASTA domain-containing protein [Candidatus Latescibacterota bacterium]|nr:PASTA domain-containing protein [Candidatus Latescibacterota bacterium]